MLYVLFRGDDFVAGFQRAFVVIAQALYFKVRRCHLGVGYYHNAGAVALLDVENRFAFFVEQVSRNRCRCDRANLGAALFLCFVFHQAQNRQCQGAGAANGALAITAGAHFRVNFAQRWAQALTRHFQQAKTRDAANLYSCAVHRQCVADAVFDFALVAARLHIDKVDNYQAAHIAQAQLAGDFIGRFQIGLGGGLFDVATFGGARRVDVDRDQCFGDVDDNRAARREFYFALESRFDLAFDLVAVKQRDIVFVEFYPAAKVGHNLLDKPRGKLE